MWQHLATFGTEAWSAGTPVRGEGWAPARRLDMFAIDVICIALVIAAVILGALALFIRDRSAAASLASGLLAALMVLAVVVQVGWLRGLDTTVAAWFYTHRIPALAASDTNSIYDFIGVPTNFAVFAVFCSALLSLRARSAMPFVLVPGAVGAAVAVEKALSAVIEHPPWTPAELRQLGDWMSHHHNSFPSGHVAGVAALLGMIAICLTTESDRPLKKAVLTSLVAAGVLVVAFLALYDNGHTFTDVIGGMILGSAVVALGAAVLSRVTGEKYKS